MSINWEDNAELCEQLGKLFERWKPLVNNGTKVLMWDYKEKESIAVIYRFVVGKDLDDQVFTIYVGAGDNLSGKGGRTSLVYQYRSGNRKGGIRREIEAEVEKFEKRGYTAWTEIIELHEGLETKMGVIESLAIAKHWLEYIRRLREETEIPRFLNKEIKELHEIPDLVRRLGFVE